MDQKEKRQVHIEPAKNRKSFDFAELWRYRSLIRLFTKKSFILIYKQTILGPLWILLIPIISSLLYLVLFGNIAKLGTDGIPQLLFYFSSNAVWTFFASCVTDCSKTFSNNAALFGKVYFPRLTVCISEVLKASIQFGIQMVIIAGFLVYYVSRGTMELNFVRLLLVFPILLQMGVLAMGCGIIASSLTTKYRDLAILVEFVIKMWMYATPVVFTLADIENPVLSSLILLNPTSAPVILFRHALFGTAAAPTWSVLVSAALTVVLAFLGIQMFHHIERTFIDTI